MRSLKNTLLVGLLLLVPIFAQSQDSKNYQTFWIHEDRVKPAMNEDYQQITKDLVAACTKHNIQETRWLTVALDDNTYLYVTPIEKLADLDKNAFSSLGEKMGKDKMNKLFDRYSTCYDEHGDYIIYLNKELSYMPGGLAQVVEGKPYRTFYFNYVTPENDKNFVASLKKVKETFSKMKSKLDYRVYKTGFGIMGTYYMVVVAGVNAEQIAKAASENWTLMEDQFKPLLDEMSKYTWKNDKKNGWMRSDLSYTPKK